MGALTLFILRLAFLAALWIFVFIVLYALRSDLFGQRVRKLPAAAAASTFPVADPAPAPAPAPSRPAQAVATRLVITGGAKEGLEISLPHDVLTIGRSSDSGLVILDDYTSTNHARLVHSERGWILEDLDSTNGTQLDARRVTSPTLVPLNSPVTIGTTTFELRR